MATKRQLQLIQEYQCAGCVAGHDPETCEAFALSDRYGFACSAHVFGTSIMGVGPLALGLPKGFCRPGFEMMPGGEADPKGRRNTIAIRMWTDGAHPKWDRFNVPVWAMDQDGALFVRTYAPRLNLTFVDVVDGGKRAELCPDAIDVAAFVDGID